MDPKRCLSYITQKKGELSAWETELMGNHRMIYGCDICQEVCPLNYGLPETPIGEFKENLICGIDADALEKISAREFRKKYGDRTFAWRGAALLKRNLKIINKDI
jgi:epoxyqueuosine reductase QueG